MRARTFGLDEDERLEVEILSPPSATGLVKVRCEGKVFVRHKNRLDPMDEEAKEILGRK